MIPVGWNCKRVAGYTQQNPGHRSCALGGMIPDRWNSKREASNYQHDLGAINKKVMIPGGWNSQREVSNV